MVCSMLGEVDATDVSAALTYISESLNIITVALPIVVVFGTLPRRFPNPVQLGGTCKVWKGDTHGYRKRPSGCLLG